MPDLSVAENVFLGVAAGEPVRHRRLERHDDSGAPSSSTVSASTSIRGVTLGSLPIGVAAAGRAGARAVLRSAHHHPGRADLRAVAARDRAALRRAAAAARKTGAASSSSRTSSTTSCRSRTQITIFRNGRKVVSTPVHAGESTHRQGLDHRAHDRDRATRSWRRATSATPRFAEPARRAGGAGRASGLSLGHFYKDVSLQVQAGEILGVYGYMGCGQIELRARCSASCSPEAGYVRIGGIHRQPAQHGRGRAGRHRLRAGEPAQHAVRRRADLQEHLHRDPRRRSPALAEAGRRSAPSPGRHIKALSIRAPCRRYAARGRCRAATSRRWRWPDGSPTCPSVLVLCEPTRGMDVGAKEDVVRIVRALAGQGVGDHRRSRPSPRPCCPLADRIVVMRKGTIAREFADRNHQQGPAARSGLNPFNPAWTRTRTHRPPTPRTTGLSGSRTAASWLRASSAIIAPFLTLLFLVVFFTLSPARPSRRSAIWRTSSQQVSVTAIIAVGLTFVILTAEIDLSVASRRQRHRHRGGVLHAAGREREHRQPAAARRASRSSWRSQPASLLGRGDRLRRDQDRHPVLHHDAGHDADRRRHLRPAGARPDRLFRARPHHHARLGLDLRRAVARHRAPR